MMNNAFVITISPDTTVDEVWEQLALKGAQFLFSEEDQSIQKIYLICDEAILSAPEILTVTPYEIPDIDWGAQWEGKNELSLEPYGLPEKIIYMAPGSGFGDLSHPTTTLVCRMMKDIVKGKKILDVGSGSGILSFIALAMGASEVIGVEIDPLAIEHAQANAILNGMDVQFFLPEEMPAFEPDVVLMNMISTEQQVAWKSLAIRTPATLITSGILADEKDDYLKWAASEKWTLKKYIEDDVWLGFEFCF